MTGLFLCGFLAENHQRKNRLENVLKGPGPEVTSESLRQIPDVLEFNGRQVEGREIEPLNNQFDFRPFFGAPPFGKGIYQTPDDDAVGRVAYVFVPIYAQKAGEVTLGFGADCWMQAWINGHQLIDLTKESIAKSPPSINDFLAHACLNEGQNVLAVRYISGKGSSVLALGGPRELRAGNFQSILVDPFLYGDERWTQKKISAPSQGKTTLDIGDRRELFVDDFLVEELKGGAVRRLNHPQPREVVMRFDKPWERPVKRYVSIVEVDGCYRFYYGGRPAVTCLAQTVDGLHFKRPKLRLFEYEGERENNIVWQKGKSGHNFTPFMDSNPDALPEQKFKAVGDHPEGGGLAAYVSADGIHWRMLYPDRILTEGAFDSQNLAFWDASKQLYACYCRGFRSDESPLRGVRNIRVAYSKDFCDWSSPRFIEYSDGRPEHLYTNGVQPYMRAPHFYIAFPLRFVPHRTKIPGWDHRGVSDAVLMSSRDGERFDRWETAFIRPGRDGWTDRMNEPAWGMIRTGSRELSLYWHERQCGIRVLRRGVIRPDGFVSLHADGGRVGEMLSRPLLFSGSFLEINYATSAIGALRIGLCDAAGRAVEGFSMADSDLLYGNDLAHTVTWNNKSDLSMLQGRPVRLRVRMEDADLYSLRFVNK